MQVPQYLYGSNDELQRYFALLLQTMQSALSDNGWTVPQITAANLTIISANMPDGTIWYVTDAAPPVYVGKISGSLVQFTTTPYP